ncbi:unnamed protein product [Rotaria socialis]|uniref:Uncharacterized protein n=1 Tax=Rotaria socialis TaxID=392032 RepID=A0A820UR01_9BILA|nr:unnamed protein product [Rotaria socialis]CAF3364253.1 unnamed protein product [Rotaria socialis]CAF3379210.1 unnamed protein product [Rotaria socialis]CAF3386414.1 unnamed protein product [Rotaria socialis]CAF4224848.1 unnamed protein product [Rotaria socialis]
MTSGLSDELGSLKVTDDRSRVSTNSTARRNYATGHNQRHNLHSKRAATIDHDNQEEKLRIVVLGATKVGKTCLCQQFLQEKFVTDHKETVDEMYSVDIAIADRHIVLEILDTAGIDEFPVMRRLAITRGDAFLIVYAVNDMYSFTIAQKMHELVLEVKPDLASATAKPMVIIGNKCDIDISQREVTLDHANTIVRDQWALDHIETTCHERESVLNAFHRLLHLSNINITNSSDITRRLSDPNVSAHKEQRTNSKRQSCAQQ